MPDTVLLLLQSKGAQLIVALTHSREPNDRKLAAEVPAIHLVLGGHDHHYVCDYIEPHMNLMVKSGERECLHRRMLYPSAVHVCIQVF